MLLHEPHQDLPAVLMSLIRVPAAGTSLDGLTGAHPTVPSVMVACEWVWAGAWAGLPAWSHEVFVP